MVQMIQLDTIKVRLPALQVVDDLLMWHGLTAFNDGSGGGSCGSDDGSGKDMKDG